MVLGTWPGMGGGLKGEWHGTVMGDTGGYYHQMHNDSSLILKSTQYFVRVGVYPLGLLLLPHALVRQLGLVLPCKGRQAGSPRSPGGSIDGMAAHLTVACSKSDIATQVWPAGGLCRLLLLLSTPYGGTYACCMPSATHPLLRTFWKTRGC